MKKIFNLFLVVLLLLSPFGCAPVSKPSDGDTTTTTAPPPEEPLVDFIVDVPAGRDPVVLQLTDTQIIDSSQMRTHDRLSGKAYYYWATENMEARCFKYLRETIEAAKPDLILLTGDNVYGEFDDKGTTLKTLINFMESFGIPWAPVMGNHDTETKLGVDWQCEQYENAEHCLFKQRELNGNGNYSVGIRQNGKITRVFIMLDTGSDTASAETYGNGHTKSMVGIAQDQIDWYTKAVGRIRQEHPDFKLSFVFHIPMDVFRQPAVEYGMNEKTGKKALSHILIDEHPDRKATDFGIINFNISGWDSSWEVWNGMKELGVDSIFCGHWHAVSASMVYQGVRLQFGQKSSTYDNTNYLTKWGEYSFSPLDMGMPQVGGTVVPISETDGSILEPYIYLCKEE